MDTLDRILARVPGLSSRRARGGPLFLTSSRTIELHLGSRRWGLWVHDDMFDGFWGNTEAGRGLQHMARELREDGHPQAADELDTIIAALTS